MTDLVKEFNEGYSARLDAGKCFENDDAMSFGACPYYASSPAGDAWLAGYAHACNKFAGNTAAQEPIVKVSHGRGYTINAWTMTKDKLVYGIEFSKSGAHAYLVTV